MNRSLFAVLAVAAVCVGTPAFAQSNLYGSAGCGLGSQLFKNNDVFSQVLAGTTNGSTWTQFFGITSGTSNCVEDGTVASNKALPAFVEANDVALEREISRGSGDLIGALAGVMGCSDTPALGARLQSSYTQIYDRSQTGSVAERLSRTVQSDPVLAQQCRTQAI